MVKNYWIFFIFITMFLILLMVLNNFLYVTTFEPIYKGNNKEKKVAFEFNVAWGNEYIQPILDILDKYNIKSTFFIEGRWASNNPELLRSIVNRGHEIGNHGYSHKNHSKLNREENYEEIKKAEEVIKSITGITTDLFAPPSGDFNKLTVQVAEEMGYKVIMWSVDTIDWKREGTDVIVRRVLKKYHNGAIILMHPTEYTVKALPIIIEHLKKEGFEIVKISDIIKTETTP